MSRVTNPYGITGVAELGDRFTASCNDGQLHHQPHRETAGMTTKDETAGRKRWEGDGGGQGNKRAVQGAPQKGFIILFTDYTKPTEPRHTTRGVWPSSCRSCLIRARRGIPPPRRVIAFLMRRGGVPVVFWRGKEGTGPPCRVLVPNSTRRGGVCPSLSCCSHFNMTRRGHAPSSLFF